MDINHPFIDSHTILIQQEEKHPSKTPEHTDQYNAYGKQPKQSSNPIDGSESNIFNYIPSGDTTNNWAGFSDKNIRRMFVQKVYSILSLQLLITFCFTALVIFTPSIKSWFRAHVLTYYIAFIIFFIIYITLCCCEGPRRNYPINLILLVIFTFAQSFMVAMICTFHNLDSVLIAAGITFLCCMAVSLLSFWTKFDFTRIGWVLLIAVLVFFIALICVIFMWTKMAIIAYAAFGSVLFMMFLAYDTQLITGGKKYEISPEEYIMASIMLYIDIVLIFRFILLCQK